MGNDDVNTFYGNVIVAYPDLDVGNGIAQSVYYHLVVRRDETRGLVVNLEKVVGVVTVLAVIPYTKCPGITHDHTPEYHPVSWAWMRPPPRPHSVALIRKLLRSFMWLAFF